MIRDITLGHETDNHLVPELEHPASLDNVADILEQLQNWIGLPKGAQWPLNELCSVCYALGFDCDARHLARLMQNGETHPNETDFGFTWTSRQFAELLQLLHDKRRWLPGRFMDCKKELEVARDECDAADSISMIEHLATLPDEELAERIAKARDPKFRKLFYTAARLQRLNFLDQMAASDPTRNEPATA